MMKENDFIDKLSNEDIDNLIGKLCSIRANNKDVQIMDNIKSNSIDYIEQEKIGIENDNIAIEDDIINSIIKSNVPLSQEEMNVFKAKGIYEKYMSKINNNQEDNSTMKSIEEEIKRNLEAEESVTEVILDDDTGESFPESESITGYNSVNEDKDIGYIKESLKETEQVNSVLKNTIEFSNFASQNVLNGNPYVEDGELISTLSKEVIDTVNEITSGDAIKKALNISDGDLTPSSDVKTSCGYTAEELKAAINDIQENCSAEQFPEVAIAVEKSKGVNALFTIAVAIQEHGWDSTVGVNTSGGNWNVFNIEGTQSSNGRWKDYTDLTDAFESFADLINDYYKAGLTTPEKIGNRYCPPDASENTEYGSWGESVCQVANMITSHISESQSSNNTEEDKEMSIEEFNDVPATELSVDDDIITSTLMERYDNVTAEEAIQLIDVMNRYKSGEKFDVFAALPESLRRVISSEAISCGADKATINFFAKSFINDLVNNIYIDKEIKDFNEELKEVLSPMNNIAGTMMDEYSDEVYHKFTDQLESKADEIQDSDPNKATELREVSKSFNEAIHLDRVINLITTTPSSINRAYKTARDNFNKYKNNYNQKVSTVEPSPRVLDYYSMGLSASKVCNGYSEAYINTLIILVANTVIEAINEGSLTEHIYAYYASNAMYTIAFTANNSEVNNIVSENIKIILDKIAEYMAPLEARNSKKNKKRNKKTK